LTLPSQHEEEKNPVDKLQLMQAMRPAYPGYWGVFLKVVLDCTDYRLVRQLWQALRIYERGPILVACNQLKQTIQDGGESLETVKRLYATIPPRLLLDLCVRVSPETGKFRNPKIVAVERRIIEQTGPGGTKWRGEV
jgi:hypothetical protein